MIAGANKEAIVRDGGSRKDAFPEGILSQELKLRFSFKHKDIAGLADRIYLAVDQHRRRTHTASEALMPDALASRSHAATGKAVVGDIVEVIALRQERRHV